MPVTLRKMMASDKLSLYPIYTNKKVTTPAALKEITNIKEIETMINDLKETYQVILVDNKIIGTIGIEPLTKKNALLGIIINEPYWHQGYGDEALKIYLPQLKKQGYQQILADCLVSNNACKHLLEKNQFKYQRTYTRPFDLAGNLQTCDLYQLDLKRYKNRLK